MRTKPETAMKDWSEVRRFGSHPEDVVPVFRPGAYGFIVDDRVHLAVVRSIEGVFLPGGGLEGEETAEEALKREALEECGLLVRVGPCVSQAVQLVYFEATGICFEKRCAFFNAQVEEERLADALPGHEVLWLAAVEASDALSHESQKWALQDWMSRITSA